uniref:G_PROTEIN_RECEP_F2_3 domain-containing protein n=1 Tax=Heterorhabditis bacteriophora TaxID=37862 RepID=A0A1I7XR03_HETBA
MLCTTLEFTLFLCYYKMGNGERPGPPYCVHSNWNGQTCDAGYMSEHKLEAIRFMYTVFTI